MDGAEKEDKAGNDFSEETESPDPFANIGNDGFDPFLFGRLGTATDECPFESNRILLPGGLGGKNPPRPPEAGSGFSMHGKDHYNSAWKSDSIQVPEEPYLPQIEEASKDN